MKLKSLLIVIVAMLAFPIIGSAASTNLTSGIKHCDTDNDCMVLCSWVNDTKVDYFWSGDKQEQLNIYMYYSFEDGKHYVGRGGKGGSFYHGPLDDADRVILGQTYGEAFENGTCAPAAYTDTSNVVISPNGVCIGDQTCAESHSNRTFGGTSSLTYSLGGGIDVVFSNFLKSFDSMTPEQMDAYTLSHNFTQDFFLQEILGINGQYIPGLLNNYLMKNFTRYALEYNEKIRSLAVDKIEDDVAVVDDLESSGAISAEEAERRREELYKKLEGILYHADLSAAFANYESYEQIVMARAGECEAILSMELVEFIHKIFNFIKFLIPIIILVLGVFDYLKAISLHDQDEIKKASTKLTKRLVIALFFFVIPTILQVLLSIIDSAYTTCL